MPITPDSNLPASIIPGCVVEFMQGDKPQLAWVMEEQSGRLRLLTITKREIKLPSARILSWAGPYYRGQASREEILDALNRHQARRLELEQSIDPMEIWELAQGELDKANLRWFAELLWDKEEAANIEHLAAMGRAMLECKTHFKFQPPEFLIHPKEKVEQRLREQQAMLERERLSSLGRQFFESLWQARTTGALPPRLDDPELAARLEHLLRTRIAFPDDQESEQVWKLVRKGLPEIPHLELLLAQIWGILPPHYNFLYDQADYAPGDAWSAEFPDDIKALAHNLEQTRQEPDPTPFISIDSETTRDVDDAFHLQPLDHGGWLLRLALARPTHGWDMDTPLAKAVAARCTSIYLPEGDSHMLPEELGLGLFSLLEQQDRPALVLEIELAEDEDGVMVQQCCDLRLAWARIAENRSYTQAEADIQDFLEHKQSTWGEMTARAWHLAEKLRDARLRRGAIIIDRQEPEVTLNGLGKDLRVDIRLKTDTPRSQLLVSEFMILANSAIALWAKDRGLALLHRTQDIALPKGQRRNMERAPRGAPDGQEPDQRAVGAHAAPSFESRRTGLQPHLVAFATLSRLPEHAADSALSAG